LLILTQDVSSYGEYRAPRKGRHVSFPNEFSLSSFNHFKCESRYYQAQNEAAKQRFIAGGIASWHEHQERKARPSRSSKSHSTNLQVTQGGNTRQLLQKEIEEEHRAAAIELMLRRRAMIKQLYAAEAVQYRFLLLFFLMRRLIRIRRAELAKKGLVLVSDVSFVISSLCPSDGCTPFNLPHALRRVNELKYDLSM
jgi:hypothetical protein